MGNGNCIQSRKNIQIRETFESVLILYSVLQTQKAKEMINYPRHKSIWIMTQEMHTFTKLFALNYNY